MHQITDWRISLYKLHVSLGFWKPKKRLKAENADQNMNKHFNSWKFKLKCESLFVRRKHLNFNGIYSLVYRIKFFVQNLHFEVFMVIYSIRRLGHRCVYHLSIWNDRIRFILYQVSILFNSNTVTSMFFLKNTHKIFLAQGIVSVSLSFDSICLCWFEANISWFSSLEWNVLTFRLNYTINMMRGC